MLSSTVPPHSPLFCISLCHKELLSSNIKTMPKCVHFISTADKIPHLLAHWNEWSIAIDYRSRFWINFFLDTSELQISKLYLKNETIPRISYLHIFSSLTGWVYQPRPGKRKRFPLPVSAVFSGTSQSIITTNPAGICPFQSPAYSVVIPNVKNNIGHPVCEFSIVNDFKNSEFTYCSKSYTYGSIDIVQTISQSFLTPLFLPVFLCTAHLPSSLYLLFPQPLKFIWLLHCPQFPAIVFVAPGYLLLPLGLFGSLIKWHLLPVRLQLFLFLVLSPPHVSSLTSSNCTSSQPCPTRPEKSC